MKPNNNDHMPVSGPLELPPPTPEEQAHSKDVQQLIRDEVTYSGGEISFARFMELALYAPGLGYYTSGKQKFADQGDFITAPELGPVFARCLAHPCLTILKETESGDILEVGAGSGALAADLLLELEILKCLPKNYLILELSNELRQRQFRTLEQKIPHLLPRVRWLSTLPDKIIGVILANELLDAMPVERFRVCAAGINQLFIAWEDDCFVWREKPASESIQNRITPLRLPTGYRSEINLPAEGWVRSVADILQQGIMLLIDYGFPRAEFYHPQRMEGTLMCHYRHRAHANPLILVGLQDITAHVDFSAVAEAGIGAGLLLLGFTSQASFLIGCGLEQLMSGSDPEDVRKHLKLTQQIKKLTLPHEMGELYKVIALGRGVQQPIPGITLQDRRVRL